MMTETIADEWDDYVLNVLSTNPAMTPEMTEPLKMIFFAGATAMFTLLSTCATPDALRSEMRAYAASIRARALQ